VVFGGAARRRLGRTRDDARAAPDLRSARASTRAGCARRPARQADPPNTLRAIALPAVRPSNFSVSLCLCGCFSWSGSQR